MSNECDESLNLSIIILSKISSEINMLIQNKKRIFESRGTRLRNLGANGLLAAEKSDFEERRKKKFIFEVKNLIFS